MKTGRWAPKSKKWVLRAFLIFVALVLIEFLNITAQWAWSAANAQGFIILVGVVLFCAIAMGGIVKSWRRYA